ncbi:response regulator transcription factor [Streptomyces sp. Go40/10]|uniref:LuxR C-terminal-related transcriptional regulator n=1 Tax=Streptomyces sp. Go40/10 TaxID=2825844 RepID=UPI001E388CB3|nr:response regulator transcription factor [Streptomyces sp. Go40/10]UFR04613.1 response regulator transcription factor [Streptomyces sp. Go40/10]
MRAGFMRVAVIGDCPVFRHGVSQLIGTAPDLRLVADASSLQGADGTLRSADVVLMDLQQPLAQLTATVAELRERGHAVIVTASSVRIDALQAIRAGASGFLSRQAEAEELLTAIRVVASGRHYLSASVDSLLEQPRHLTGREQDILRLVASGATDDEIASRLSISKYTVRSHLDRIGEKTGSRRRSDLTRMAIENGLTGQD